MTGLAKEPGSQGIMARLRQLLVASITVVSSALVVLGCTSANQREVSVLTSHRQMLWESESPTREVSGAAVASRRDLSMKSQNDGKWVFESEPGSLPHPDQALQGKSFDLLLLSWNLVLEPGAGAIVEIRVGPTESGGWSPYLQVGTCGILDGRPHAVREFTDGGRPAGRIDVDQFVSQKHYSSFGVRVTAVTKGVPIAPDKSPVQIERLAIWCGDSTSLRVVPVSELVGSAGEIRSTNEVPFRAQRTPIRSLSGRLCSPTSLTMVLEYYGANRQWLEVAQRAHDPDFDIYGNWPRSIQVAFECGVPGFLTRFSDWQTVANLLADGHPIIASIAAPKGVIRNAPYKELNGGHLIVLTGTDGNGGVYVNDPAATDASSGKRIYSMADLSKAWLELGKGTAYVLLGDPPRELQSRSEGNE